MKPLWVLLGLSIGSIAFADHVNTGISFNGWSIESSEDLYLGKRHTSYPLQNLFDRRKETAWVYGGMDYPLTKDFKKGERSQVGEYCITVTPPKGTWVDELRIMNGYNKSESLFRKNSRATEIQIYDTGYRYDIAPNGSKSEIQPIRTVKLSDALGEKSIWLPKRKYGQIMIRFKSVKKGAQDDLCISELQLRAGGKDLIPFPKVFDSTEGDECGCGGNLKLMTYSGKVIGQISRESSSDLGFDSSGRFYAGIDDKAIWIADLSKQRKIRTLLYKGLYPELNWIAPGKAIAKLCKPTPSSKGVEFPVVKSVKWNL